MKNVMKRAWEIYRMMPTTKNLSPVSYKERISTALKMAWREFKTGKRDVTVERVLKHRCENEARMASDALCQHVYAKKQARLKGEVHEVREAKAPHYIIYDEF